MTTSDGLQPKSDRFLHTEDPKAEARDLLFHNLCNLRTFDIGQEPLEQIATKEINQTFSKFKSSFLSEQTCQEFVGKHSETLSLIFCCFLTC